MQRVSKEEFMGLAGHEAVSSTWLEVDQDRINQFADATNDHQYIHVDPGRAAQTPMGTTIAHGFLTLSLLPYLSEEIAVVPDSYKMVFNYGLNKVRFMSPVKVGAEVRLRSKILGVTEKQPGRLLVATESAVEIRGEERPALVAETLAMFVV